MKKWYWLMSLAGLLLLGGCSTNQAKPQLTSQSQSTQSSSQSQTKSTSETKSINWQRPSENKPYPDMQLKLHRWLQVSTKQQRVYVMSANRKVLYTMYASTGAAQSPTPRGTYHLQAERGQFFYNQASHEGARYWTSFKDHGVYLFHTVPTNAKGQYLMADAKRLGKRANSHGCIRLSIPDAKWINQHVPTGTKVVIE